MRDLAEKLIRKHEGKRNRAYQDSKGIWTIGIGHNLESNPISDEAIEQILKDDITDVEQWLNTLQWFYDLDNVRQAVIIDMTFNLGRRGLMGYHRMIKALKEKNYLHAASEILDSKAGRNLKSRYGELAEIMRKGEVI